MNGPNGSDEAPRSSDVGGRGPPGSAAFESVMSGLEGDRPGAYWEEADMASSTEAYARRFAGAVGEWFLEVQAQSTLELIAERGEELKILDVGGGHGQLTPHLVAHRHTVTVLASDPSCRQRVEPWLGERCMFETGNLAALPYADRSFNAAIAFRLLAHVQDWQGFLAELCRVADDFVVVDYPPNRSVNALAGPLFPLKVRAEEVPPRRFRVFRMAEVNQTFGRHGFSVAREQRQFIFPMALHRVMSSLPISRTVETAGRVLGARRILGSPLIVRADRA